MFTIVQATYESIILASGTSFEPTLEPADICRNCVEDTFLGTSIYPIIRFLNRGNRSHVIMSSREAIPIRTSEACCSVRCGCQRGGFHRLLDLQALDERCIRFSFVRTDSNFSNLDVDWRQPKPKMHVPSQSDPAPDSQFFRDHVVCEHGGLALNISARTRISHKVCQRLFAPVDAVGPCAMCDTLAETSREDKRELRKKAEEEKVDL